MNNANPWTRFRLAALAAALALGGCIAFADPADFNIVSPSPERVAIERAADAAFINEWDRFDRDGDGALNRDEWRAHDWAVYLIMDADHSGDLDISEYVRRRCGGPPGPDFFYRRCQPIRVREFLARTGSASGRATQRHVRSNSDRWFRMNDRNHDGVLSRAEVYVGHVE